MRKPSPRKLLVASVGVAAVSYALGCDNKPTVPPTAGNLQAYPQPTATATSVPTTLGTASTPGLTPNGGLTATPKDPSLVPTTTPTASAIPTPTATVPKLDPKRPPTGGNLMAPRPTPTK